jgi:hypothetical protein
VREWPSLDSSRKIIVDTPSSPSRQYSSPPHALIWSFRKSRDNWKRKYLDVKAQLKRASRRLDRLDSRTTAAPPSITPSPLSTASSPSDPSFLHVLDQEIRNLNRQVHENRQLLEHCQQQDRAILDLTRQILHLAGASALPSATLVSDPMPPHEDTNAPQPLPKVSHPAPAEPKKGAH